MKIFILTPLYWPSLGGVQVSMRLTAAHLVRQGHEVTVLTSQMKSADGANAKNFRCVDPLPPSEKHAGVSIRRFPTGGLIDLFYGILFSGSYRLKLPFWPAVYGAYRRRRFRVASMLRYLCSQSPDLLLVAPCADEFIKLGAEARRRTGVKLAMATSLHISSFASDDSDFSPRELPRLKEYDALLANTVYERDFLIQQGMSPEKVHVTGVPVDLKAMTSVVPALTEERLRPLSQKKFVLYLGRKEKGKGIGTLVDIFEKPSEELRDVTLVLAGVTSDYFEKKIRPRTLNHTSILVVDSLDEASKWWLFKHAAAYCMVSNVDSFGITYLEAWLSGLPVVAADLPAMRCVIREGEDGLLAPYGDKERIREALVRLVSDEDSARLMGEKGRQKVSLERGDYAVEKKVEKILEGLFLATQTRQAERPGS